MDFFLRFFCQPRNRQAEDAEEAESVDNLKVVYCTWGQNNIYIHKNGLQSRKFTVVRGAQMLEPASMIPNFSSSNDGMGPHTI